MMKTDIQKIYETAKESYYNGNPIMSDYEFDELESSLGLENNSYIGTRHNPSYTIKHPFIMGSLSKVQVKEKEDSVIDWNLYYESVKSYICKASTNEVIISPKYDGCSFECVIESGKIVSISSRGDGEYGKDLTKHLVNKMQDTCKSIGMLGKCTVIRGEVLIKKSIFGEKYSSYVNPRSFVAGILGSDYEDTPEFKEKLSDLDIVVYDIRINNGDNIKDLDWDIFDYPTKPKYYIVTSIDSAHVFENTYKSFEKYRNEECEYALDGFVIKPISKYRLSNTDRARPIDCVAVKFVPMLEETIIESIDWSTGKTNELIPVINVKPVIMDGKVVSRASAHNYGYIIDNKLSIGCKVILSLAGDIIPFIYKVTDTTEFDKSKLCIPDNCNTYTDGCHLYKILSDEELKYKLFYNSALCLKIPGLGKSNISKVWEYVKTECKGDEFFGIQPTELPINILELKEYDFVRAIGGVIGNKISKEFIKLQSQLRIKDIIGSMCIEDCGTRICEEIENYLLGKDYSFGSMARKAYDWVFDINSEIYKRFDTILRTLNTCIDEFKEKDSIVVSELNTVEQIPVILTGEPNNYSSKGEFLKCNPQYRVTGSWKECKIVFTNSLESKTGKMKKAIEKNIEIKIY